MRSVRDSIRGTTDPIVVRDLGLIDYREAWDLQRHLAEARADVQGPDHLLLLEHPSVYTAGRRTEQWERPIDGTEVIDVDRGGKITWHGPGQLVGYPIIKLDEPVDVVNFVRRLEEALIALCAEFGLDTIRVDGRSGVWLPAKDFLPERKIAAIGVRVQRGVTLHGYAINCNPDLKAFNAIVPCGINNVGVTSLTKELGREVTVADIRPIAERLTLEALDGLLPVGEHAVSG